MKFKLDFFLSSFPEIAAAMLINLQLAALAIGFALVGGTALTILRAQKIRAVNLPLGAFMGFIRGTPLIIQIFLCYYALPSLGVDLAPMTAGVLAIGVNSSVFVSEIQRGGLLAIDPGQIEAATALGLKPTPIWRRVVLPQLFRNIVPMLVNEATVVIKGTALVSVITVVEALRKAQQLGSAQFSPFEPLVAAAILFFLVSLLVSLAAMQIERRISASRS